MTTATAVPVMIDASAVIAFGVCAKPNFQDVDQWMFSGKSGGVFNTIEHQAHYDRIGQYLASA